MINRIFFKLGLTKIRRDSNVKFNIRKKQLRIRGKIIIGANSCFSAYDNGEIEIGDNVKICENCKLLACNGNIVIGEGCQLGDYSYITGQGGVNIGRNVLFASHVNLIANEHKYQDINKPISQQGSLSSPIIIKEGTWIGINCTILAGSIIGKNCVVGANSLVKGKFPDHCVLAGNPAKIIKKYNVSTKEWLDYNKV